MNSLTQPEPDASTDTPAAKEPSVAGKPIIRLRWILLGFAIVVGLFVAVTRHENWLLQMEFDEALATFRSGVAREESHGRPDLFDRTVQAWEYRTARLVFERLANEDHAEAMYYLGNMYDFGMGVEESDYAAFRLHLAAAHAGDQRAYRHVGNRFAFGRGVQRSREEALIWYRRAAETRDTVSYALLANALLRGDPSPADITSADRWLKRGIRAGEEYAAERRIDAILDGAFGPIDMDEVVELHKWLALKGNTDAMENLIWILRNTGPMAFRHPEEIARIHDAEEAYKWTLIAMSHWTDTENSYFDPASTIPLILLNNYRELLDRSVGPGGWDLQNRQPIRQLPSIAARDELGRAVAEARRQLAERARIVLSNPEELPPLPVIPEMPYRLDRATVSRAERDALIFLETAPFDSE